VPVAFVTRRSIPFHHKGQESGRRARGSRTVRPALTGTGGVDQHPDACDRRRRSWSGAAGRLMGASSMCRYSRTSPAERTGRPPTIVGVRDGCPPDREGVPPMKRRSCRQSPAAASGA
jgi:hypothetical protein